MKITHVFPDGTRTPDINGLRVPYTAQTAAAYQPWQPRNTIKRRNTPMRIKRRKYRTLAFAYKTAGLLWGLVHVCAVVGFLTDWTQPLLYAGIGLFSLLTVNACIGGCWRAEARADRLTRQIAETDKQHRANRKEAA